MRAVQLLRQRGVAVAVPMQAASGHVLFPVGKDFTLTANQILELLDRGELNEEGVRKLVKTHGAATPSNKKAS